MENYNKLKSKIKSKKFIIGVVGLGYVGLPISFAFANKKFRVIGFDNDRNKIKFLKKNNTQTKATNLSDLKKKKS